jgi:hypothetical protein
LREFFALELPPTATLVVIGLLVAVSGAALVFLWRHQSRRQR